MSTPFHEYGRPRRVAGGIRARSARGPIGESWWARRFLAVLESFALGTRLTRGRSYARAGQVLDLTIAPGVVTATVQGSRARPYQVRIGLAPFPAQTWERIETQLAAQAFFSARLLAGDLPPELEQLCADVGAPLFPAALGELTQRCDCPDAAVPCKHLAAVFYLLAEAFDADPFELLHWRGRRRAELLERLRALRTPDPAPADRATACAATTASGGAAPDPGAAGAECATANPAAVPEPLGAPAPGSPGPAGRAVAPAGLPAGPLAEADRFWHAPVPLPDRRPPTLATEADLLLRQLAPPGRDLGGPGLLRRLRPAYERFGAAGS